MTNKELRFNFPRGGSGYNSRGLTAKGQDISLNTLPTKPYISPSFSESEVRAISDTLKARGFELVRLDYNGCGFKPIDTPTGSMSFIGGANGVSQLIANIEDAFPLTEDKSTSILREEAGRAVVQDALERLEEKNITIVKDGHVLASEDYEPQEDVMAIHATCQPNTDSSFARTDDSYMDAVADGADSADVANAALGNDVGVTNNDYDNSAQERQLLQAISSIKRVATNAVATAIEEAVTIGFASAPTYEEYEQLTHDNEGDYYGNSGLSELHKRSTDLLVEMYQDMHAQYTHGNYCITLSGIESWAERLQRHFFEIEKLQDKDAHWEEMGQ